MSDLVPEQLPTKPPKDKICERCGHADRHHRTLPGWPAACYVLGCRCIAWLAPR